MTISSLLSSPFPVIIVFVVGVMPAARGHRLSCRRVCAEATGLHAWMVGRRVSPLVSAAKDSQSAVRVLVGGVPVGDVRVSGVSVGGFSVGGARVGGVLGR